LIVPTPEIAWKCLKRNDTFPTCPVGTEDVVVILSRLAGQDPGDARLDHLHKGVLGAVEVAAFSERLGEVLAKSDVLVEQAVGEQPVVTGELPRRRHENKRRAEEV
jgi:hypothetical protein